MPTTPKPRNLSVKRGVIPGITYKVASAATTMTNVVREAITTGMIKADKVKVEERLNICTKCEHFNMGSSTCNLCGCFLKFKTQLIASVCPIKKW